MIMLLSDERRKFVVMSGGCGREKGMQDDYGYFVSVILYRFFHELYGVGAASGGTAFTPFVSWTCRRDYSGIMGSFVFESSLSVGNEQSGLSVRTMESAVSYFAAFFGTSDIAGSWTADQLAICISGKSQGIPDVSGLCADLDWRNGAFVSWDNREADEDSEETETEFPVSI